MTSFGISDLRSDRNENWPMRKLRDEFVTGLNEGRKKEVLGALMSYGPRFRYIITGHGFLSGNIEGVRY